MKGGVIEPYVKLRIIGHLCDEAEFVTKVVPKVGRSRSVGRTRMHWRQKIIRRHAMTDGNPASSFQNGFNPSWNESFTFVIRRPEFCFVEFRVKTRSSPDDGHLASYVASFSMLRPGFRNVPLENYAGARLTPASLFVHVRIEDGHSDTDTQERARAGDEKSPLDNNGRNSL